MTHVWVTEVAKRLPWVSLETESGIKRPQTQVVGNAAVHQMEIRPFVTIHKFLQTARLGFACGASFILCRFIHPGRQLESTGPGIALDGDGGEENRDGRGGGDGIDKFTYPSQLGQIETGFGHGRQVHSLRLVFIFPEGKDNLRRGGAEDALETERRDQPRQIYFEAPRV